MDMDKWFVFTMDDGIQYGPFDTKRQADIHRGDVESTKLRRLGSGIYHSGRYYVAIKQVAISHGFDYIFDT